MFSYSMVFPQWNITFKANNTSFGYDVIETYDHGYVFFGSRVQ